MLDFTNIFETSVQTFTWEETIVTILLALLLGAAIGVTYKLTTDAADYSRNFFLTLILVPAVIAVIILLIGSNVARAFSLAGAFSIIRFRSAPGNPKDITYVLFSMASGLACGALSYIYAVVFTLILCAVMILLFKTGCGTPKQGEYVLKILIPENLNFNGIFDEILKEYGTKYTLTRIKTLDMGSVFELCYSISLKNGTNIKEFMDKIRCRNGNLTVSVSMADTSREF